LLCRSGAAIVARAMTLPRLFIAIENGEVEAKADDISLLYVGTFERER
jgi:hypothetical protein